MNTLSPFLAIASPCNEVLQSTMTQLLQAGFRPVPTFDLQTARLALEGCACPHHGTDECDCQMIVLLVYGAAAQPVTLILHGNDGQTWISITDSPWQGTDRKLMTGIRQALEDQASIDP